MSDTELTLAEEIFSAAVDLEPEARAALLDARCGDDEPLRADVERLLAAADASGSYFDELPARFGIDRLRAGGEDVFEAEAGQQFGQYRLTELLGTGGMGAVWRAERADGRFEGEVAVKLLTRHHSRAALERFDREAHYLAKLTHPNIARLIDAGVGDDDVPFLILEYVEGERIDSWCDSRAIDIEQRLRLLISVAEAVSHAHARLVVHSDIKPSNVLVTRDGTVKLLDFGIASLLDDSEDAARGAALTPEYAAPEQFASEPVSTATDVYALGLLLYLLLTGSSPRRIDDTTDAESLKRAVGSDPPSLASTFGDLSDDRAAARRTSPKRLLKTLRGELDPIVLKALAVDPQNRYQAASDLANDLARYLADQPVSALPHTVEYRARKFVARHRGGIASALLVTIALVSALALAVQQMVVARAERDAAEYERQRTAASNEFYGLLLEEMGSADRPLTALELLDRGAALLSMQYDETNPFMGRIHFDLSRHYASLPEFEREMELLGYAETAARNASDDELLASVLCAQSTSLLQHDAEASAALASEATAVYERLRAPSRDTRFYCVRMQARHAQASNDYDRAFAILEAERRDAAAGLTAHGRALLLTDLGLLYFGRGDFVTTVELLDEALDTLEQAGRGNTLTHTILSSNKATVLSSAGEYADAANTFESLFRRYEDAAWAGGRGQLPRRVNYASTLVRLSRGEEAMQTLLKAREDAQASGDTRFEGIVALWIASCNIELERLEAAETALLDARAILSASPGVWEHQLVHVSVMRSAIARKRGQYDEALEWVMPLLADKEDGSPPYPAPTRAALLIVAARAEVEAGNFAAAAPLVEEYLAIREAGARRPELSAHVGAGLVLRAKVHFGLGDTAAAIADLENAVIALGNGLGADNIETIEAEELLASYQNMQ